MAVEIDPIHGPEIMELLAIPTYALEDPHKFNRIREVVEYFQGNSDRRSQILSIISKRHGDDKLDVLWTWVQLRKEMVRKIHELDADRFTENIQREIEQDYLTKGSIDIIKSQIDERTSSKEESSENPFSSETIQAIKTKLEEIESIKQELEVYG